MNRQAPLSKGPKGVVRAIGRIATVAGLSLMTVFALSAPAAASPPENSSGTLVHYLWPAPDLLASWSTCPEDGPPPVSVTCLVVDLWTFSDSNNRRPTGPAGVNLVIRKIRFDAEGTNHLDLYGTGQGVGTVSIDAQLTHASVSATVPIQDCTSPTPPCTDAGSATIAATFAPWGDVSRGTSVYKSHEPGSQLTVVSSDVFRYATAIGVLDGVDLGTTEIADMGREFFNLVVASH